MSEAVLVVADVHAGYDDALVLRGVTLRAAADEIVSIIGPNGAGKSTLLKAVAGIVRPTAGKIVFKGEDVTGIRPDRLARKGMGPARVRSILSALDHRMSFQILEGFRL